MKIFETGASAGISHLSQAVNYRAMKQFFLLRVLSTTTLSQQKILGILILTLLSVALF